MDTNQRRDAPEVKTHEEILAMLRELDILEERIKNLQLTQDDSSNVDSTLQGVERVEPYAEVIPEPQPEVPTESIQQETPPEKRPLSLLKHHHTPRAIVKARTFRRFSVNKQPVIGVPETKTPRYLWKRNTTDKPLASTFHLHLTEEGSLVGLDMQRPKPPKPQIKLFQRHQKAESGEQPPEAQESGFKGKMKRVVSKLIPRRSKTKEAGAGIGGRLKGIVKRKPKE